VKIADEATGPPVMQPPLGYAGVMNKVQWVHTDYAAAPSRAGVTAVSEAFTVVTVLAVIVHLQTIFTIKQHTGVACITKSNQAANNSSNMIRAAATASAPPPPVLEPIQGWAFAQAAQESSRSLMVAVTWALRSFGSHVS
jgi:hypothetical protein